MVQQYDLGTLIRLHEETYRGMLAARGKPS